MTVHLFVTPPGWILENRTELDHSKARANG